MTVAVVLLVLGSALAHATWNALLKRSRDPENTIVAMMGVAAAVGSVIALALRTPIPAPKALGWILASGVLEAGYFVTLSRALSRAPLGRVYTIVRGGALVVVWPISMLVLGESMTFGRAIGTVLVGLGLAATGFADGSPTVKPEDHGVVRSGLVVAAVCALFVGGYHLAYKLALSNGGRPEAVNGLSLSTAVLLNLVALTSSRRALVLRSFRQEPVRVAVGGVLGSVGFLVFLFAMKSAGAGVVLTLRNVSILFAQGLGIALGERPRRLVLIGAALVTMGAVLLTRS